MVEPTFYEIPSPAYTRLSANWRERVPVDQLAVSLVAHAGNPFDDYTYLELTHMDNPFMVRAIQLSIENVESGRGGPFGAVVVRDGVMIGEAANQVTTTNDPTAHAEVLAIRAACRQLGAFDLEGCEIYTSCEPCAMCLGAIYWARLARVYFANFGADASKIGFDDSLIYREIAQPRSKRKIPMIQMMRKQALAAFRAWENKPNKIEY